MRYRIVLWLLCCAFCGRSQPVPGYMPSDSAVAEIRSYTLRPGTRDPACDSLLQIAKNAKNMIEMETRTQDSAELSELNRQFIENFTTQDAARHDEIIHKDFVCIQSDGSIVGREEYMKGWPAAYTHSGYTAFTYTDESIRIFGDIALVRSKTVYTKKIGDKELKGNSVYTDTYVKENHHWKCIQAQITPVAQK